MAGFDFIFITFGLLLITRSDRVSSKRKRHVAPAPIITTSAPLLCSRAVSLWRLAVIEEKTWVAFQGAQHSTVRKNKRCANEAPRPIAAAFSLARIQQDQVLSALGRRMVCVRSMKISNLTRRVLKWLSADAPTHVSQRLCRPNQFNPRRFKEGHREKATQLDSLLAKSNGTRKRSYQIFPAIAIVQSARSKKQGHRGIHRCLLPSVPCDAHSRSAKLNRLFARN